MLAHGFQERSKVTSKFIFYAIWSLQRNDIGLSSFLIRVRQQDPCIHSPVLDYPWACKQIPMEK